MKRVMYISFLVPEKNIIDVMSFLNGKVFNMEFRPVESEDEVAVKKAAKSSRKKKKGDQGVFLRDLFAQSEELASKQIKLKWEEAGFPSTSLQNALNRAVKRQEIQRIATGQYKVVK